MVFNRPWASLNDRVKRHYIVLFSCAMMVYYHHYFHLLTKKTAENIRTHNEIIAGVTTRTSANYRVLTPYLNEVMIRGFNTFMPYDMAFVLIYGVFEFTMVAIMIFAMYRLLSNWFTPERCLLGSLLFALSLTTTMTLSYTFHPWSFTEGAIFFVALIAIYEDRYGIVLLLSVLAVANRKTGLIVPLAYVLANIDFGNLRTVSFQPEKEFLKKTIILVVVTLVPFLYLTSIRGDPLTINYLVKDVWLQTLRTWDLVVISLGSFLGISWVLAVLVFPRTPRFIRRISLILLAYIPAVLLLGDLTELRLFIPTYPILIPAITQGLCADEVFPTPYPDYAVRTMEALVSLMGILLVLVGVFVTPSIMEDVFSFAITRDMKPVYVSAVSELRTVSLITGLVLLTMFAAYKISEKDY